MPMRTKAIFQGTSRNMAGDIVVSFAIEDEEVLPKLEKIKEDVLVVEVKKFNKKRSLSANAYFWVLCDKMAEVLRTTKEDIYNLQLSRYGVFLDVQIAKDDMPSLISQFRYVEEFKEPFSNMTVARCYLGSSTYDKKQMARLIDGTVEDAKELGIDTWTPEEIAMTIQAWEGEK